MLSRLALATCLSCFAATAWAADVKREVVYDITGDFDHDGKPDRAALVIVGPGMTADTSDLAKDRYWVQDNEQVSLLIYLGAGDAPLDITKPPSFEKDNLANHEEHYDWAVPLAVNKAGSLQFSMSQGWGSSHESDETLTIGVIKGQPMVIGYDFGWALPQAEGASCSIDLQKGNAVYDDSMHKKHLKVKISPVALKDWKAPDYQKICKVK